MADPFMFATGTHDGAVKIWTVPPAHSHAFEDEISHSRAASTHLAPTPRTASPSILEPEFRTDSPSTAESQEGQVPSSPQTDSFTRDRTVAFLRVPPP